MFGRAPLSPEEQQLRDSAPEECLRRIVARGGLALDDVTAELPPAVAEALRVIATGERAAPEGETLLGGAPRGDPAIRAVHEPPLAAEEPSAPAPDWTRAFAAEYPEFVFHFKTKPAAPNPALDEPRPAGQESPQSPDWARTFAATYPRLVRLLEEGRVTPRQAVETIWAIEGFLGSYPTGARYAAP